MHETLRRSSLGALSAGSAVNLERAMPANGRFGGHIVSGHIDGTGRITSTRRDDVAVWYDIERPKPSPATSLKKAPSPLTVSASPWRAFRNGLLDFDDSHTADVTALGRKRAGDIVNLECDIIGKYVEKASFLGPRKPRH